MDKTAELLEELEGRRTFSAFLTSRKSDDPEDSVRLLSGSTDYNTKDNPAKESKDKKKRSTLTGSMGRLAEFIQRDRAVYKQRTWLARLPKQQPHEDHCASEASRASSPYPAPIAVGGGGRTNTNTNTAINTTITTNTTIGTSKKKKKRHSRKVQSGARMTPGGTLHSIGESCEATRTTTTLTKPIGGVCGVDVKAWPIFRQYKSIVATSAATRVPRFKPGPVILRNKGAKLSSAGLPPTLASIIASSSRTASPQLQPRSADKGKAPMDPMFPLHLVRLAVIDGEEQKACAILEDVFGISQPLEPAPSAPSAPKIKANMLTKAKFWPVLLRIWLRAVDRGMESLLLMLYSAGIPASPLAPITFAAPKRPPPPSSGPKFYTLAGITSSVSILSSGSAATTAASSTANWLQRNYRDWLIDRFPSFLLAAIAFGRTRLVQAMIEGARKTAYALVNGAGWLGFTPLLVATSGRGHLHLTRSLLEAGADPIIGVSYHHFLLARRKLLPSTPSKKPAYQHAPRAHEWAKGVPLLPIEVAAASHNFELVLMMLGRGLVPMRLGLLVQSDLDITVRLLKAGALSRETDAFGNTAMHRAAAKGRPDLIALYLHYGCPIDAVNVHGCTALHEAAAYGQKSALRYLIQAGADCSIQNQQPLTALEVARRHGYSSEDLADYFSAKPAKPGTNCLRIQEDMKALILQVDSYNLGSDLDQFGIGKNSLQPRPTRAAPVQQQRKGRFLIEKIINPKQWWS